MKTDMNSIKNYIEKKAKDYRKMYGAEKMDLRKVGIMRATANHYGYTPDDCSEYTLEQMHNINDCIKKDITTAFETYAKHWYDLQEIYCDDKTNVRYCDAWEYFDTACSKAVDCHRYFLEGFCDRGGIDTAMQFFRYLAACEVFNELMTKYATATIAA